MSVAELPRPGVEVIQRFRTQSPTVTTPTLVPTVVGACKQVVDAVIQSAAGSGVVNSQAQTAVPAFFVSSPATGGPPVTWTLNGHLDLVIDGHVPVVVTFVAGSYKPSDVVSKVNEALATAGETAAYAEQVGSTTWRLRSVSAGDNESIIIASTSTAGVLTAFGLDATDEFFGASTYQGYQLKVPTTSFPDPRSNLDELSIEVDTVRAFLGISGGTSLLEALQTQALLRKGTAVTAVDDGNGDNQTPYVDMAGEDFTATTTPAAVASTTGTAAPTFGAMNGTTLVISDGRAPKTVTFSSPIDENDVAAQIQALFNPLDGLVVTGAGAGNPITITSNRLREDGLTLAKGEDSQIVIYGGSALPLIDPTATPTTGIHIGRYAGDPQAAVVGDQLYVDGLFLGNITQVAPNGQKTRLKLDKQVPLTFTGSTFYIVATKLAPLPTLTNRPAPNLIVDQEGNYTLKLGIMRDTKGHVIEAVTTTALIAGRAPMYTAYRALRLDVTQKAKNPGLLRFSDTIQITDLISPITPENPLGLGTYFASLNAPAVQITALGVDAISADSPFGTVEAFTRAATYLEGFEVYAIAPLTHDSTVGQVFKTHVDVMSAPESKGERIVLMNPSMPTHKLDTLVCSSTDGNSIGATGTMFDTGIGDLPSLLLAAGYDPTASIPVEDTGSTKGGLFLDIADNDKHYSVKSVAGSVITVRTTAIEFPIGTNDDSFYAESALNDPPLPAALINDPFSLRIRGTALVLTDGSADKDGIADTYAALGQSIVDRRYWQIAPDQCAATIGGLEQLIDGFYMCAAIAGMIGQQPPQQSFTNFPMTGFTRVVGSTNYFTEKQMNRMAGGGNYVIVQDADNAPLIARMALTTDLTSIETRTDSITKIVDFTAKFLRRGLKNFIGRFNITQGFLDSLGHVLEGLLDFLKGAGVLIGAQVNNIIQDTTAPDTVIIDITLDVPYPCNYIRLTLVI